MYVNMYDLPQPDRKLTTSTIHTISRKYMETGGYYRGFITTVMWYVIDNDILSRVNNLRSLDDDKGVRHATVDYKL